MLQRFYLPEEAINSGADINAKLDALVACYQEVIRDSQFEGMERLNLCTRRCLSEFKGQRKDIHRNWGDDMMQKLFYAFDEKLFKLCQQVY